MFSLKYIDIFKRHLEKKASLFAVDLVSPLDKGTSKKNDKSNFLPVSILITFSKINEKVHVNLIDKTMNRYLFPFISIYQ